MKMLRYALGATRIYEIKKEHIRGTSHVGRLGGKLREGRLKWFGHVMRSKEENTERILL